MDEDMDVDIPIIPPVEVNMIVDDNPIILEKDETETTNFTEKSMNDYAAEMLKNDLLQSDVDYFLETFTKLLDVVSKYKIHCTGCDKHMGSAPTKLDQRFQHPILKVLLCAKCFQFYCSGEFEKGEDGSELYCRWCGEGGYVFCCTKCPFVFCKKCISRNLGQKTVKLIGNSDNWVCFACNPVQIKSQRVIYWAVQKYGEEMQRLSKLNNNTINLTLDKTQCCTTSRKRTSTSDGNTSSAKKPKVVKYYIPKGKNNLLKNALEGSLSASTSSALALTEFNSNSLWGNTPGILDVDGDVLTSSTSKLPLPVPTEMLDEPEAEVICTPDIIALDEDNATISPSSSPQPSVSNIMRSVPNLPYKIKKIVPSPQPKTTAAAAATTSSTATRPLLLSKSSSGQIQSTSRLQKINITDLKRHINKSFHQRIVVKPTSELMPLPKSKTPPLPSSSSSPSTSITTTAAATIPKPFINNNIRIIRPKSVLTQNTNTFRPIAPMPSPTPVQLQPRIISTSAKNKITPPSISIIHNTNNTTNSKNISSSISNSSSSNSSNSSSSNNNSNSSTNSHNNNNNNNNNNNWFSKTAIECTELSEYLSTRIENLSSMNQLALKSPPLMLELYKTMQTYMSVALKKVRKIKKNMKINFNHNGGKSINPFAVSKKTLPTINRKSVSTIATPSAAAITSPNTTKRTTIANIITSNNNNVDDDVLLFDMDVTNASDEEEENNKNNDNGDDDDDDVDNDDDDDDNDDDAYIDNCDESSLESEINSNKNDINNEVINIISSDEENDINEATEAEQKSESPPAPSKADNDNISISSSSCVPQSFSVENSQSSIIESPMLNPPSPFEYLSTDSNSTSEQKQSTKTTNNNDTETLTSESDLLKLLHAKYEFMSPNELLHYLSAKVIIYNNNQSSQGKKKFNLLKYMKTLLTTETNNKLEKSNMLTNSETTPHQQLNEELDFEEMLNSNVVVKKQQNFGDEFNKFLDKTINSKNDNDDDRNHDKISKEKSGNTKYKEQSPTNVTDEKNDAIQKNDKDTEKMLGVLNECLSDDSDKSRNLFDDSLSSPPFDHSIMFLSNKKDNDTNDIVMDSGILALKQMAENCVNSPAVDVTQTGTECTG